MTTLQSLTLAALFASTVAACGPHTPAAEPAAEPSATAAASTEPAMSAEPTASAAASAAPPPAAPAKKTYDLAEYKLPFSIELSNEATHKKQSEALEKAGFVGAIVYDDAANVGIRVNTVPAAMRTIAGLKADLKKGYGATFLKEDGELLVYDKTNKGATKVFGFTLRIDVGGKIFVCESAVTGADEPAKLDASIAACKSLKPVK